MRAAAAHDDVRRSQVLNEFETLCGGPPSLNQNEGTAGGFANVHGVHPRGEIRSRSIVARRVSTETVATHDHNHSVTLSNAND